MSENANKIHKKLLIVQVAALSQAFDGWDGPALEPIDSVLPAVTCTVQASFRTAAAPAQHGMIANGLFFRELGRPMFWEQSARLVGSERIWSEFRQRGGKVAMLFWQQSMGEDVDIVLSPAPIHKHHGGMIQDCYCKPEGLYERLFGRGRVGRKFKLQHYWGPLASHKSGQWIAQAAAELLADTELGPDLCLTYLPTLDYDLQRYGSTSKSQAATQNVRSQLDLLLAAAKANGYEVLIYGDYAIAPVSRAALPNLVLRQADLMNVRDINGMAYPDFHTSRAWAMVDHEIAHVYVRHPDDVRWAAELLVALPGVGQVLGEDEKHQLGLDHPNSGELVLLADDGWWFAYPWWDGKSEAPDYAAHVDIHNKPGFDPCELFFGWPPMSISQNTSRIAGSHGRIGTGREVVWGATFGLPGRPTNLIELAKCTRDWLS